MCSHLQVFVLASLLSLRDERDLTMEGSSPIVTIQQGKLKGEIRSDYNGGKFYCFLGVPYAKPPIGELRFKAPLPAEPWTGTRDATKDGDICYSGDQFMGKIIGSEDCLFVNIFVKKSCGRPKPVMVWIHGGGYTSGTGNTWHSGPDFFMIEHIVLVTMNYRLGALGFLCLEDTSLGVPGNAGLKDQSMALRWVSENIRQFGGDPGNITIIGESAGASSCHFHILSPMSKGLFQKAILQSGCTLDPWVWGRIGCAKELAEKLGLEKCGCNEKKLLKMLRDTPVEKLYEAQQKCFDILTASVHRPFGPVIEKPNETAFITEEIMSIILSGKYHKVPMIIGYNTSEGGLCELCLPDRSQAARENVEVGIPWHFNAEGDVKKTIVKKLKDFYFKDGYCLEGEVNLQTDSNFLTPILGSVKAHFKSTQEPIYFYRMSFVGKLNFLKTYFKLSHVPGVCHADDLGYLFKNYSTPPIDPGSPEDITVRRFIKLWTNFAKCGNPTPDPNEFGLVWPRLTEGKLDYLDIGENLTLGCNPEAERRKLWKEIYDMFPETKDFL